MAKKEQKTMKTEKAAQPVQMMTGRVDAVKMTKSATVLIEGVKTHPLYNKSFKRSKKYLVHDEIGVKPGDVVQIVKIRPMSKLKHWSVVKVIGRDLEAIVNEELKEGVAEAIAEVMPEEKVEAAVEAPAEEVKEKKTKKGAKK